MNICAVLLPKREAELKMNMHLTMWKEELVNILVENVDISINQLKLKYATENMTAEDILTRMVNYLKLEG